MSHQLSMINFYKSKLNPVPFSLNKGNSIVKKRPSLSLNKTVTPTKTLKKSVVNTSASTEIVIDLCSDDDNIHFGPRMSDERRNSNFDGVVPEASQCKIVHQVTQKTPEKGLKTPTSRTGRSPRSKIYSPTKKRMVPKISPIKRNLAKELFGSAPSANAVQDEAFTNACEGMDDKSIFLLTIIHRYLKDESLKQLLDENCQEILMKCLHIVKPGMRVACRLYWLLPGWYRKDKLISIAGDKMDDPEFYHMINSLVDSGLMIPTNESSLSFSDCTSILKLDEIKQICKHLKLKIQSKQHAIEALREFSRRKPIANYFSVNNTNNNSGRVLQMMREKVGLCFKLSELAQITFHKLHILMYMGMNFSILREKKLEFLLINDKSNMERYPVDKKMVLDNASVIFRNTDDFTRYKALPMWLRRFTPPHIYIKIMETGIQDLKRNKSVNNYTMAVDILTTLISQIAFRQHKKAEWYAEKSLILHNLLDSEEEAAAVLIEGLQSDLSDEAKDAMRPRALILAKRKNIDLNNDVRQILLQYAQKESILENKLRGDYVYKLPMDNNTRGKLKFETRTKDGMMVQVAEDYCISYYLSNGQFTHGEHWEGRIVTTIFFLLFWDIVYTKPCGVTGIFLTHYQQYPLDMFCESFYINRKTLIDERLMMIKRCSDEDMLKIMREKWDERPECEISGIVRHIGWENVEMVCECLGARRVCALAARLAAHYAYAHTGFPDLTLWNYHTKQIKFVEVKTDADKPSIKQLQWMSYLQENGIDTGFCYLGGNKTRPKSRPMT